MTYRGIELRVGTATFILTQTVIAKTPWQKSIDEGLDFWGDPYTGQEHAHPYTGEGHAPMSAVHS